MNLRTRHPLSRILVGLGLCAAVLAPTVSSAHASPSPQGIFSLKVVAPASYDRWANTDNQWTKNFRITGLYLKDIVVGVSVVGQKSASATFSMMHTKGLTLNYGYSSFKNQTFVAFKGKIPAVNKALADLRLNSYSGGRITMKVVATTDTSAAIFEPINGHFFKYVASPRITWADAKVAAEKEFFRGVQGYLATVASESENSFISANIENASNIWLGGSDAANEGEYKWVTGPEAGKTFWKANCATKAAGSVDSCTGANSIEPLSGNQGTKYKAATIADTVVNTFAGWDPAGEPNNWGLTGENYVATNWQGTKGKWNDLSGDTSSINGYLVEFSSKNGGPVPQVVSGSTTLSLVSLDAKPQDMDETVKGVKTEFSWTLPSTTLPISFKVQGLDPNTGWDNFCTVTPTKALDIYSCEGPTVKYSHYLVSAVYKKNPKSGFSKTVVGVYKVQK